VLTAMTTNTILLLPGLFSGHNLDIVFCRMRKSLTHMDNDRSNARL
jgi:hypothetical protein